MSGVRFRLGLDEVVLVPRRSVVDLDLRRALALVSALDERERDELQRRLGGDELVSDDDLARALVESGAVLVTTEEPARLMSEPSVEPLQPLEPSGPVETTTSVALEVLHETGGTFGGARLVAELPSGELVDGRLDERSRWARDGLVGSGPCRIRFLAPLRLTEEQQRRPSTPPCAAGPEDLVVRVGTTPELSVRVGRAQRVVARLPPPIPVVTLGPGCFVSGQVFPTPAVVAAIDAVSEAVRGQPGLRASALAHADVAGDPAKDKALSDRRAEVLRAVLLDDLETFERVADADGWSLHHDQAMLRLLGCNPAAIDGIDGPFTQRAARWFQAEYSRGIHHPDGLDEPLPETGVIDAATRKALRRAYLLALSPQLGPEQLVGPGMHGCGGFNPSASGDGASDRGGIALWPKEAARMVELPCRVGDADACLVDDRGVRRCRFHRETFDLRERSDAPVFFDFEWVALREGRISLSAVTSLPHGTVVRFHVFRDVRDYGGRVHHHHGPEPMPMRGAPVGTPVEGDVRQGVCVGIWTRPDGWDPFDWHEWLTEVEGRAEDQGEGNEADAGPWFHPPLFAIEYSGGWVYSRPPGERIDRFVLRNVTRAGLAMANDGSFVSFRTDDDVIVTSRERRADEHVQIVGWCAQERSLREEGGQRS
ncbi:hypothetical protein [Paraliomyxa miuraensis]|uniref:hypothetical protein n=1 Tax=Paraliomyxa miuraensis TaxID=376150 RepID=UPI00225236AD|nr:hypothetical protein [Paraliomyxa miuraensis]MCX4246500.1 hypothetical protein [Paraliomyxa miuraensis]